jgi:hypothetical protein
LEKDHPFVECATFADDSKSKGWDDQADWHYTNIPFFDDDYFTTAEPENMNITWALVNFTYLI